MKRDPAAAHHSHQIPGYEILEEIGRGGMGVVYRAVQLSTRRTVAIKVLLAGQFAATNVLRRFQREAELAARLKHPHIVRVLTGGEVGELPYLVMEYVEGTRLDRYLVRNRLEQDTTLTLLCKVCDAVEHAHQQGVVHRDLKPSNILVDAEGEPHILDFGLAKATDSASIEGGDAQLSVVGQVMGTLAYLSPEQAAGESESIDARSDVFTLGILLFNLLTGEMPFPAGKSATTVLYNIMENPPPQPSAVSQQIDKELETIILKALEKDQADRYQSAGELGDDLSRFLAGEPILARPPSSIYLLRKRMSKHRFAVSVVVFGVLLVAVMLTLRWQKQRQELFRARQSTLRLQRLLEESPASHRIGNVAALYNRFRQIRELRLVLAQYKYWEEELRNEAIRLLENATQENPDLWECQLLLAEIYQRVGDPDRARLLRNAAEAAVPDTADGWYLRSFTTMDIEQALVCADRAVSKNPNSILAWERLTYLLFMTKRFDRAMTGTDRLLELGLSANLVAQLRGGILARIGEVERAVAEYSKLTGLNPDSSSAYRLRGHAARRAGEYELAVDDYSKAIELDGGVARANVWDYYHRATPLWILGRREEAVADYQRVRVLLGHPFYSDARMYVILCELDRCGEGELVLAAALEEATDPWLVKVLNCMVGKISPQELVTSADPDNQEQVCEAYYYAGEACLIKGRIDEARIWFDRCQRTNLRYDVDVFPISPMNEHELAQWRLDTIGAGAVEGD
jgi:serine/threonine protein kinase/Flp pilus assembly protein TadD